MRKTKLSIMDRIEIILDRFMEVVEVLLPIWFISILLYCIIQIIQRG
jgi:hypothetical protein